MIGNRLTLFICLRYVWVLRNNFGSQLHLGIISWDSTSWDPLVYCSLDLHLGSFRIYSIYLRNWKGQSRIFLRKATHNTTVMLTHSFCIAACAFVSVLGPQCAYLTGWQQVVGQVSFLSQCIIYRFKVALLNHVEGLREQRHKALMPLLRHHHTEIIQRNLFWKVIFSALVFF